MNHPKGMGHGSGDFTPWYPLVNSHDDPGSHRGWKIRETIKTTMWGPPVISWFIKPINYI